jgi:hypothetical protein
MRSFLGILTSLTAAILLTSGPVPAQGQIRVVTPVRQSVAPANDKVMRVHGVGGAHPQPEILAVETIPKPLTPLEKTVLSGFTLAQLSVSPSFTLTPAHPLVANRGALLFLNASAVNAMGSTPAAFFKSQPEYSGTDYGVLTNRALTVSLYPLIPGKHYLIDCTVSGGDTYFVRLMPEDVKQSISGTNHIVVVLEAGGESATIGIAGKTTNLYWFFYSAEVTRID